MAACVDLQLQLEYQHPPLHLSQEYLEGVGIWCIRRCSGNIRSHRSTDSRRFHHCDYYVLMQRIRSVSCEGTYRLW